MFFIFFWIWKISYSQSTEVEKYYVRVDTLFITQLTEALNNSTQELFKALQVKNENRENLGFGYQLTEGGKGVGSTTFNYKILYFNNDVIAYQISTYIKDKKPKRLKNLYKERLSKIFQIDDQYNVEPIFFGIENTSEPLDGIKKSTEEKLDKIMNPFAGTIFGNRCGYNMNILNNRKLFDEVIEIDNCEYLMHSINPATRLMAIEFYYFNQSQFSQNQQNLIDLQIEKLEKTPLITKECYGCSVGGELTKKLISEIELQAKNK